jgi:hypothetical protein
MKILLNAKAALKTAGAIFFLVALAHTARLCAKTPLSIGSADVPVWTSAAAAIVSLVLAFWMFKAAGQKGA